MSTKADRDDPEAIRRRLDELAMRLADAKVEHQRADSPSAENITRDKLKRLQTWHDHVAVAYRSAVATHGVGPGVFEWQTRRMR